MANPTIKQNKAPAEPSLMDLLNLFRKQLMLDFNCHHIGTIQSFDPAKQTCRATINYKKTFFQPNPKTKVYESVLLDYPILVDCPVIVLGGGTSALTFPIAAGDECLLLFNDRDIDNWFQSGQKGPVATPRLHSFSDGIALVGLRSLANSLQNYDTTRAVLRNGSTMVGVGASLVKIANNQYTLNGLLQELINEVKSLVSATAAITVTGVQTGGGVSGVPANAATITAISSQLATTANKIAALLE